MLTDVQQGRQAYEFYGASVFGFVIDPVTSHGFAFGADPMYISMKKEYVAHAQGQLDDYGAMIHTQYIKKKFGDFLDPVKLSIIQRFKRAGNDHETLRKILKEIWLRNLSKSSSL
jgi:hypothetical protein